MLILGVFLNLGVLVFFKYTNFLLENLLGFFGLPFEAFSIILPLGISFFTFQQVSYLLDVRRGVAGGYKLLDYMLYVCFFPQLIAGPIVRHNELIPQFSVVFSRQTNFECLTRGLVLFILGLSKKVFVADELGTLVDPIFLSAGTSAVNFGSAWQATLGFTLQLYFEFSSYSDMALGLAGLFGLKLPINFDRPYVSLTVREFWRRWHITLSRFFTDYVYIPLGGNRNKYRIYLSIFLTMILSGIWHGAGWTFVLWGAFHGMAICINRIWQKTGLRLPDIAAWALTFFTWTILIVFFRSDDMETAYVMYQSLFDAELLSPTNGSWLFVASAFAASVFGPTNVEISRSRLLLYRTPLCLVSLIGVAACLRIGTGRGLEFIYFQF